MGSIEQLKKDKDKRDKGTVIVESDYVLRDKTAERKDPAKVALNTRNITNETGKYAKELERIKMEARVKAEVEAKAELMSGDFIAELKEQLKKEILEDTKATPKGRATGGK
jgi:rubrerythrin